MQSINLVADRITPIRTIEIVRRKLAQLKMPFCRMLHPFCRLDHIYINIFNFIHFIQNASSAMYDSHAIRKYSKSVISRETAKIKKGLLSECLMQKYEMDIAYAH